MKKSVAKRLSCNFDWHKDKYSRIRWQICRNRNTAEPQNILPWHTHRYIYIYVYTEVHILSDPYHLFTAQTVWRDVMRPSDRRYSSFPRVRVHAFYFSVIASNDGILLFIYRKKNSGTCTQILLNHHSINTLRTSTCCNL